VLNRRGDSNLKELEIMVEKNEHGKQTVWLGSKGTGIETEGGAFASPENRSTNGQFTAKGAEVVLLGTAVAHKVELQTVSTF
jgi:hypothetical protein